MQKRNYAWRKHHLRRMRKRAFAKLYINADFYGGSVNKYEVEEHQGKAWQCACRMANNMAKCSSWCCGNPRRWFKTPTLAELKSDLALREYLEDI